MAWRRSVEMSLYELVMFGAKALHEPLVTWTNDNVDTIDEMLLQFH